MDTEPGGKPKWNFKKAVRTIPKGAWVAAAASWLIGTAFAIGGFLSDVNDGWLSRQPFTTNLVSAITSFLFAVPIVLLGFSQVEEYLKEQQELRAKRLEEREAEFERRAFQRDEELGRRIQRQEEELREQARRQDEARRAAAEQEARLREAMRAANDTIERMIAGLDSILRDREHIGELRTLLWQTTLPIPDDRESIRVLQRMLDLWAGVMPSAEALRAKTRVLVGEWRAIPTEAKASFDQGTALDVDSALVRLAKAAATGELYTRHADIVALVARAQDLMGTGKRDKGLRLSALEQAARRLSGVFGQVDVRQPLDDLVSLPAMLKRLSRTTVPSAGVGDQQTTSRSLNG
ncbi:hypothetical protein ACIBQ1_08615 [Nonomuraea sp. NPDC050153]|uniref:hypothetical protein n=1 Tax=Nonomuraea sp. NPDC050153 TaxID=3364359 RepID=UPI00379A95BE